MGTRAAVFLLFIAGLVWIPSGPAHQARDAATAIQRGVAGLRALQRADGSFGDYGPGSTALAALALLESGVARTDAAIISAAKYVRPEAVLCTHTYSVSLIILFMDRLGESNDKALIKALAERLVAGQQPDGGWTYGIPLGDISELQKDYPRGNSGGVGSLANLNTTILATDQSNTQFAILGSWVGHRYGVDIQAVLKKSDERFRGSPVPAGAGIGWGYHYRGTDTNGPRTCCGLLGLAAHMGEKMERVLKTLADEKGKDKNARRPNLLHDRLVRAGLQYMRDEYLLELNKPQPTPNLYFMWSVERTAMTYGLTHIYGINWYRIGYLRLLACQAPDGTWTANYTADVDTSFALLFLNRSNLARDLTGYITHKQTSELKSEGKAADLPPGDDDAEHLVKSYLSLTAEERTRKLQEFRETHGVEFTEALALLIPKLESTEQKTAREYLATRLARMTQITLRERLKDPDAELRRAACVACAMKVDKVLIPDLIKALDDGEPWVVRAAGVALARLTGENFGPAANASAADRAAAVDHWKRWWQTQRAITK